MKSHLTSRLYTLVLASGIFGGTALADVKLPAIISDNMVLQQDSPTGVWGWAAPGEKVIVKFAGKSADTAADAAGKWGVKLEALPAGTTGEMTIAGKNNLTIKNVVVGEVWVASGQSNMEFHVATGKDAAEEAKAADFPMIRMFTVTKAAKTEPADDCVGKWEVCTPQTVPGFSAVGYFFARRLYQTLKQPIGVIHTSWGGTPAEFWTPKKALAANPAFQPIFESWDKAVAAYPQAKEKYDKELAAWKEATKTPPAPGAEAPKPPRAPRGGEGLGSPSCLYNGMIAPILNYTIRGAIWYQGEANAGGPDLYKKLFPAMIRSWRQAWQIEDFPFLYVQLANFMQRHAQPTDTNWARLREAQLETLEVPHTGMAVIIDIGESGNIHPKNKQDVGLRLALWAEATVYYRDQEYSGPLPSGFQIEDGKARLTFRNGEGMKAADGGKIKGFAIAGEDRKFVWADAEIQGDHVVITSPEVPNPVAVRYAWDDDPECNLINNTGLPASPFRTDTWPMGVAK
ncbi:MAG: sialate O-acetylesterase [Chthoniobacter sp.]|uniref:sialate O-acetylesterase n=1 Tax=Chthoniobacter sp. TaxID=2510640 RepID=UPI0032A215BF